ncbi:Putative lipoprotein lprB [Mycolicibacterium smegmatis MC2 155]|uniref:Lipoprotein lprB n=1 Tax=Mycolicibacterium smegmatis (strain ATCC 700084 / mc(2)155) TaxID=246196 RepID=I7GEI8_MYCS2|nr:Putative lipoprotein lprB [Mycolicibacterium smegmatis MC2 155]
MTVRTAASPKARSARTLAVLAAAMVPVFAACSTDEPASPEVPQSESPSAGAPTHGPFFPQCGGISDQTVSELTQVPGLVNTATNSSGCQWLQGGSILGPHFSFTWFRGSPIGRERKTEELSRASVEDINIEGHGGFIAVGEDPLKPGDVTLCEIGIQFDDDFIEWSVSYSQKPFPDPCEVAKELTRQSIVNSK